MLLRRLYYRLKPVMPYAVRLEFRRWRARRLQDQCRGVWPVDEAAAQKPAGWPGWPGGKRFAFVLTHDVESQAGVSKVRALAEAEMQLGFRSSFNFIPEGGYQVPAELLAWLSANGFEVGVHDLQHDGKLYQSLDGFRNRALRINQYVRQWNAAGFRSAFMFHRLDWLHHLDVAYDASTFDTDPFEPQPDGVGTIFPFWIPAPPIPHSANASLSAGGLESLGKRRKEFDMGEAPPRAEGVGATESLGRGEVVSGTLIAHPSRKGYVELPYTLPQDFTLFAVLQSTSPEVWLRKFDWVAGRGGMALLNVHPDYVQFPGESSADWKYPLDYYTTLLRHARTSHPDAYWQPLPRDLARWVADIKPLHPSPPRRRICMVTHSFYESDNRVMRYAESLAARGDSVDVLALRREPGIPEHEILNGVNVHRLQSRTGKKEQGVLAFLTPVLGFLFRTARWIAVHHRREKFDLLHVHNIPDFMVFAAGYPRMTGARVILDIHDIVPEFFASKFSRDSDSIPVRMLRRIERLSARGADHVIIANHLWLDKYTSRSAPAEKCSVFINNVDEGLFHPRPRIRKDDRQVIIFPGGLQWHQGLDLGIEAFARFAPQLPRAEFHVYGDGNMKPALVAQVKALGLGERIRFFDPLPIREIARVMAEADLGIVPKRADSFGNEAYSTKIMEFLSLGVPAIVSRTRIDEYYFNNDVVRFFDSGNVSQLAAAMLEVLQNAELRARLISNGLAYARQHCWSTRKVEYLNLVDRLITTGK